MMGRKRRAIFAGFWGGLLAGLADASATLWTSGPLLGWAGSLHFTLIAAGLGAFAGAALAMVFIGWSLALEHVFGSSRWFSGGHVVTLLLALPLLVYDSVAMFAGPQASRIPGHRILSVAIILAGALLLWGAVTLWACLLSRAEGEPGQTPPRPPVPERRGRLYLAGALLVGAALAAGWADRNVLPRLYPWFHLSLTLIELVLFIAAVRLLLETGRRILGKRWSWTVAALAMVLLAIGSLAERSMLAKSQRLRFYVYEKSRLGSLLVRSLPNRKAKPAAVTAIAAEEGPPLPAGPHRPGSDVVLITIDAVRADHLGCYGYGRPTSPAIDGLAAGGVRFDYAYAQAPHTSFSLASLMIGKYYPTLARLSSSDTHETLAMILRRYGWKTAAFFPPAVFYIDAHKMKTFESSNFDFEYVKYEYLGGEGRIRQIEELLQTEDPQKLFLWLHLFEPHEPYDRHDGFDFGPSDRDRYDSEIAYSDSVVGKVVALIRKRRPSTIVVVAADHGEEFGEHGGRYHGTTLFDEQIRVPLIVSVPGLEPAVVPGPVELIDIPATLLGLLDIPLPARMRGTDLGPWLSSPPAPHDRLPPAFAEVEDKRMVVLGAEKLICDVSKDYCSLYDRTQDPRELQDFADKRPERVAFLRQRLDAWLGQQARFEAKLLAAADGTGELARAIERGRLGDATAAEPLARMLAADIPVEAKREAASLLVTTLPPRPETLEAVRASMTGADPLVRDWAAVAASRLGAKEAELRLKEIASRAGGERDAPLAVHASLALAEAGVPDGAPALIASLEDCGHDVALCKRVLLALGKLEDGRAVAPLIAHLAFVQTRRETVDALASLGRPESIPALIGCLESDPYASVRSAAARALATIGGARARQALELSARREREPAVAATIREALSRKSPPRPGSPGPVARP